MPRPRRCRNVSQLPPSDYFKPRGIPLSHLSEVVLTIDELEALRLGDLVGLYQEQAASNMEVSRQTFGRIITSARKKVAEALVSGKAVRIDGGEFRTPTLPSFVCGECDFSWTVPQSTDRPAGCPECSSKDFRRADIPGRCAGRSKPDRPTRR
jgi:predicted DNA-binding protein (UPF0251 family)